MPTIKLEQVTKRYKRTRRNRSASGKRFEIGVEGIDLTIEQGEFVFIIGSSGAGKSTLLELISGQLKPNSGTISVDGKARSNLIRPKRRKRMRLFGEVHQHHDLIRKLTVEENLKRAIRGAGHIMTPGQTKARIEKVLGLAGIPGVEKKYPGELPNGDVRRVELAQALINSPPVLVLDEITANLNDDNIWDIFHLLTEINRRGTTVIMATHASQYVNIMCKRVVTLVDGKVFSDVQKGKYGDVV